MVTVYLFLFVVSLVSGLCAIIGFAGGIVLAPVLLYIYPYIFSTPHLSVQDITNITIIHSFIASGGGTILHYRMYKEINIEAIRLGIVPVIIGSLLGTSISLKGHNVFVYIALFIMTFTAFLASIINKKDNTNPDNSVRYRLFYIVISFLIPFVSNITGLGGGFIFMAVNTYVENWNIFVAGATSLTFNAISALCGFLFRLLEHEIHFNFLIVVTVAATISSVLAVIISHKLNTKFLKFLLNLFIIYTLIRTLWEILYSLKLF